MPVKKKTASKRAVKVIPAPAPEPIKVGRPVTTESGNVFIIQKAIPISGTYRSLGPNLRYPFSEMLPGDSFEIKTNEKEARKVVSRMSSSCSSYVKTRNTAAKFTVRRTGTETVRVWRIK